MIDFNDLVIRRIIIHTINRKQYNQDTAVAIYSNEISVVPVDALSVIQTRLIDAAGRGSKAFELEIKNTDVGSFFDLSKSLSCLDDENFIQRTCDIAYLLAISQTRASIPGGYLIVMDCVLGENGFNVCIVIKAEPHEALKISNIDGHEQLNVLQEVFLSPSQKLYKIGIVYQKGDDAVLGVNDQYGGFLYDDQFRVISHPAEYFYKDFLGFSVGKNSKIQSQRFYDKTESFILSNIVDIDDKIHIMNMLKAEFAVGTNATISPKDFARSVFPNQDGLLDAYIGDVCRELPNSFVKSCELIRSRLRRRRIDFPSKINIVGPEELFDNRVVIITEERELAELSVDSHLYTIVKIVGRPYESNE